MTISGENEAKSVLGALQAAVDSRDARQLIELFVEPAVLIGSAGDGRDTDGVRAYLTAVVSQPESLRWDWDTVILFHEAPEVLGFAAFGDIVVSDGHNERRAPIRATVVAVRGESAWQLKHFHGSIPSDF